MGERAHIRNLENRQAFARLEGSNPSLSATLCQGPGRGSGGRSEALARGILPSESAGLHARIRGCFPAPRAMR